MRSLLFSKELHSLVLSIFSISSDFTKSFSSLCLFSVSSIFLAFFDFFLGEIFSLLCLLSLGTFLVEHLRFVLFFELLNSSISSFSNISKGFSSFKSKTSGSSWQFSWLVVDFFPENSGFSHEISSVIISDFMITFKLVCALSISV